MTPEEMRALEDVRGFSKAGRVALTRHAKERMIERGIRRDVLVAALSSATHCRAVEGGKWSVMSVDQDGEPLVAIVVLEDQALVVTVF